MGICMSFDVSNVCEATVNLILDDARIQKFPDPVQAEQILKDNPGYFVCSSDGIYVGKFISEFLPQEELQIGQLYFLLPRRKLEFVVSEADMVSLLLKASNAAKSQMRQKKYGGKVCPYFNTEPHSDDKRERCREQSSSFSSSPRLCYVSRTASKSGLTRWKSSLEVIAEVA